MVHIWAQRRKRPDKLNKEEMFSLSPECKNRELAKHKNASWIPAAVTQRWGGIQGNICYEQAPRWCGFFLLSFLAVQGRFVFNSTHCQKPVAKLILTARGKKCEYAVNSLKARWWEEILQLSASARWRPGDLCKVISKIKSTCAQLLLSYSEGLH